MVQNTKNTTTDNININNNYHKGKLVMKVDSHERQLLVDRLVIYMIKTKKYKTRSDAIYSLLKERLDQIDIEEQKKPTKTMVSTIRAGAGV